MYKPKHQRKHTIAAWLLTLVACSSFASNLDEKVIAMSQSPAAVAAGEETFQSVCATCHAKDLSGATGFNLKDGEWIHGNTPTDIIKNIKQGFGKAGMPAFASVYTDEQIQQITAYILSKRQGFENLTYKIYHLKNAKDLSIDGKTPAKTGKFHDNIINYRLPEVKHYAMEVEGTFYTLKDQATFLDLTGRNPDRIDVEIDGNALPQPKGKFAGKWPLKKGKQHLKITFYTGSFKKRNQRDLQLMVNNKDGSIKLFPISQRSKNIFSKSKYEIKANEGIVVQRKRVLKLPAYSISVGYPNNINYAFNTRTCSVVGLWQGDFLNIGPNINARGQDASIPLGAWVFNSPQTLSPMGKNQNCKYEKMTNKGTPAFYYAINGQDIRTTATVSSPQHIAFEYEAIGQKVDKLSFKLPKSNKLSVTSPQAKIKGNTLTVDLNKHPKFTIEFAIKKGE